MVVQILQDTDYTPTASDSPKCWGQLRLRDLQLDNKLCGERVTYFRKGAKPELTDVLAERLISEGRAERIDAEPVTFVSTAEILDGMPVN